MCRVAYAVTICRAHVQRCIFCEYTECTCVEVYKYNDYIQRKGVEVHVQ